MNTNTKPTKLPMVQCGAAKTGLVCTNFARTQLVYMLNDHHTGLTKIKIDPATVALRIETAEEASQHMTAGRVGGGLVAGAILLGPLGAALGGGIGAAARKSITDKYLVIETETGETYSARLRNSTDYKMAEKFVSAVEAWPGE